MALSQQEFEKLKLSLQNKGVPMPSPSIDGGTSGDGFIDRVSSDISQRNLAVEKAAEEVKAGKRSQIGGLAEGVKATAGTINDITGEVIKSGVNFVPQALKEPISDAVKQGFTDLVNSPIGKLGLKSISTGGEMYKSFKEAHPDIASVLEAVGNLGIAVPTITGVGELVTPAKQAITSATKSAATTVAENIGKVIPEGGTTNLVKGGIDKVANIVSPIEEGTKTVLNPTRIIPKESLKNIPIENLVSQAEDKTAKFDRYVKLAEKAVNDYSQPTPLVVAGNKADEALNILTNKLNKQSLLKKEALGSVGEKLVNGVPKLRQTLRDELRDKVGINLIIKTDNNGKKLLDVVSATGRASKIAFDPADNKLIKDVYKILARLGNKPTVMQLDDTVDALQDMLYKRKTLTAIPVNGQVEGTIKSITGRLNKALKKVAGEQYTKANSKFAYFIDTQQKLNKALGQEGVRGGTLMKQLFSPSGEAPRRLFSDIKKLTGIDLVEEATLAKFAMENVGDARQASLLEEAIKSGSYTPSSFVATAAKRLLTRGTKPLERARKIINKIPNE